MRNPTVGQSLAFANPLPPPPPPPPPPILPWAGGFSLPRGGEHANMVPLHGLAFEPHSVTARWGSSLRFP